ncbi:hypothetical protein NLX83_08495 [Allokutzneria sp. A3M-2-11 16]|uniref:hypothetical protein n=1 Tax=Allokutzneria sp. A3M-2-11 16 TaxID=2962043 RepID=UPI0020B868DC|nr:hypothetical protein [Allokutzneria sp. A3M-2-11 16]MCP3799293.1 hypothetical protein [Allokutzneria sp. A3M-2-11 16]
MTVLLYVEVEGLPLRGRENMKRTFAVAAVVFGSVLVGSIAHAAPAGQVLGPNGLGDLKLGMSEEDAYQTGMLHGYQGEDPGAGFSKNCSWYGFHNRPTDLDVLISPTKGVSVIFANQGVRTVQGIGIGSSRKELLAAYPEWSDDPNGRWVRVPGNANAGYAIDVRDDKVIFIGLYQNGQECAE